MWVKSESDGDGGAREEKKTEAEVVGQHQERLVRGGSARPG